MSKRYTQLTEAERYHIYTMKKQGYTHTAIANGMGLDRIRKKGNKANHEVSIIPQEEAAEIFAVLEVFLRLVYEYPATFEEPPT